MPFQNKQQEQPKTVTNEEEKKQKQQLKNEIAALTAQRELVQGEVDASMDRRLGAARAIDIGSAEKEIERLKDLKQAAINELLEIQGKISKANDDLSKTIAKTSENCMEIKRQETRIDDLKKFVADTETAHALVKSKYAEKKQSLDDDITLLEKQKALKTIELSTISTAVASASTEQTTVDSRLTKLRTELKQIEEQIFSCSTTLAQLHSDIKASQNILEKQTSIHAEKEAEFTANLNTRKKEVDEKEADIARREVSLAEEIKWNDYRTDTLKKIKIDWEQRHGMRITAIQFPEKTPPQK